MLIHCRNEAEQTALGGALAGSAENTAVIFLHGDLGAGKTTLIRGFLRQRGWQGPVRSPTYTLIEPYPVNGSTVYHLDLYRLGDPEELEYLGLRDILAESAVVLVEWPERGAGWLPQPDLVLDIRHLTEGRDVQVIAETDLGKAILNRLIRCYPKSPG